ncbi:MAG: hypothetical protein IPN69_24095 [Acidobacteria bacterium]|nr:hypothetical protein [Acidobacteriota bacterium]
MIEVLLETIFKRLRKRFELLLVPLAELVFGLDGTAARRVVIDRPIEERISAKNCIRGVISASANSFQVLPSNPRRLAKMSGASLERASVRARSSTAWSTTTTPSAACADFCQSPRPRSPVRPLRSVGTFRVRTSR